MRVKLSIIQFNRDLLRATLLVWQAGRRMALVNMLLQCVQALLPVASLYCIKQLVEVIVHAKGGFNIVLPWIVAFGAIQFLLALASQYASYINTIQQQKLSDHLSGEVLKKACEVDYEYYENPAYHDTLHLAQHQSLYKAAYLLNIFNQLLLNSLSLIFLIFFFLTLHPLFAVLFIVLSIPLAVIKWYSGFVLLKLERKFAPLEREADYLHNVLTGVSYAKEVRVFGFADNFIKKFNGIRSYIHEEKKQLNVKLMRYSLIAETMEIVVMAFIFGLLAKYALEKTITLGFFVIYIQGFQRLQTTSKNFLQALVQLFQQRLFLKDLFLFFDIPVKGSTAGREPFPDVKTGLSVQHLSFNYPQTDRIVLNNVSFNCKPGNIIAIVGENGSGKSTLVKLLARIYDQQSGEIKIDSENIADITLNDFRQNTIFLFQDFEKYFFTIEENIALGDEAIKEPRAIEQAATLSGAHSFIKKLSLGYKTRMGRIFRGSEQLSGGQWQKLALSRIFYKKAKLVVLDEPTSALDPTAELELFKNVKEQMKDNMVILISHRLYNLKIADYVYVIQEGSIAEEGRFEDLIGRNGAFKKMYDAQKL